jgi:hypothetical protein
VESRLHDENRYRISVCAIQSRNMRHKAQWVDPLEHLVGAPPSMLATGLHHSGRVMFGYNGTSHDERRALALASCSCYVSNDNDKDQRRRDDLPMHQCCSVVPRHQSHASAENGLFRKHSLPCYPAWHSIRDGPRQLDTSMMPFSQRFKLRSSE